MEDEETVRAEVGGWGVVVGGNGEGRDCPGMIGSAVCSWVAEDQYGRDETRYILSG